MWFSAVLAWLVALAASLVAARSYPVPVALALLSALAFGGCAHWLRARTGRGGRAALVLLALPLLVFTVDNMGRGLHLLGGPLFRLLLCESPSGVPTGQREPPSNKGLQLTSPA